MPADLEERNLMHELQRGNVEVEEWERVVSCSGVYTRSAKRKLLAGYTSGCRHKYDSI